MIVTIGGDATAVHCRQILRIRPARPGSRNDPSTARFTKRSQHGPVDETTPARLCSRGQPITTIGDRT
jgi:hypothetical protein